MKNNIIEGISLENFRVFKDKSDFELAPITILTGANSSGKSTLIKAQKLLKTFWEDENNSHNLDINKGNLSHQLGDYENVINDCNENNEIKVTYSLIPIYVLGELIIEVVFTKDEDSQLKNGKLKSFSVSRKKDNQLLFSISIEQDSAKCFIDRPYFVNTLFPEINMANNYAAIAKKYVIRTENKTFEDGEIKEKNGYKGSYISSLSNEMECVTYDVPDEYLGSDEFVPTYYYFYEPKITEEFCSHIKVDKSLFNELNRQYCLFKLKENSVYSKFTRLEDNNYFELLENAKERKINEINYAIRRIGVTDLDEYEYLPRLLSIISKIPNEKYDEFYIYFWNLLKSEYPEIENRFTLDTFINFSNTSDNITDIDSLNVDWVYTLEQVKSYLMENVKTDFKSFLKEMEITNQIHSSNILSSNNNIESCIKDIFQNKKHISIDNDFFYILYYLNMLFGALFPEKIMIEKVTEEKQLDDFFKMGVKKHETLLNKIGEQFTCIVNLCLKETYSEMYFIDAIRATAQRLYSFDSGNSFNVFLRRFLDKKMNKRFLNKWINEFEIGEKIEFELIRGVGTEIFIIKGGNKINIVDLGYGVTQFLPLLLNIVYALSTGSSCIVIEEPEENLHPQLQSQLADLFFDAYKQFGIHFIIETHSEYLIRKLQYMTAKGDVKPDETVIHYIGNPNATKREPEEEQIRTIHIKPNGQLTKPFGSGFIDESSRWIKEMFMYSNQN